MDNFTHIHFQAFAFYIANLLLSHNLISKHAFHFILNHAISISPSFYTHSNLYSFHISLYNLVSREPAVPLDEPSLLLDNNGVTDNLIGDVDKPEIIDEKVSNDKKEKKEKVSKEKKEKIPKAKKEKVPKIISGYNIPNEKQDLILSLINNANNNPAKYIDL